MWEDLKYLVAYTSPLAAALGIYYGGFWSPGAVYLGFVVIPVLEFFLPARTENTPEVAEKQKAESRFFDALLYINVPIVYGLLVFFSYRITATVVSIWEIIGMTASMGVIIGTCAINVAHELGHRTGRFNAWMARLLLVPAFYTHFTIEHNYGHHRNVGTPDDPATARKGEPLYAFWWRSVIGSLRNAWRLEKDRLHREWKKVSPLHHHLVLGLTLQCIYLAAIVIAFGWMTGLFIVSAGVFGFLLLETVNYIEHYGLMRRSLPTSHYESVEAKHSWNSNHELGRIFLYELTRHADHHYQTNRRYQVLRHLENAPQMPYGYPATLLMALIPPLWRRVMDGRLINHEVQ